MSWFPSPSSPRAALRDLVNVIRHSGREQRIGAALALLVTATIVIEFVLDSRFGMSVPEREVVVQLYPSNRTDADIIASQKKDQAAKLAAQKKEQQDYQRLAKRLHID